MWLILHHAGDAGAHWLTSALRDVCAAPVHAMDDARLASARGWSHRVTSRGADVAWDDPQLGRITDSDFRGVINRLVTVPAEMLAGVSPERRLATFEALTGFFASWLHGIRAPVLNRPAGRGLCGPVLHRSAWLQRAAAAGLPTCEARVTSADAVSRPKVPGTRTCFVVDGTVASRGVPPRIAAGCVRLAEAAGVGLLAVELEPNADWRVRDVPVLPDLRLGGDTLLQALCGCHQRPTRVVRPEVSEARL